MPAKEIKKYIGKTCWNDYFKFCFERNPWDRVVSLYYFLCNSEPRPSITEFIASGILLDLRKGGYYLYTIDDKIAVDKIYLFENIDKEIRDISKLLGFPEIPKLPRAKSGYRNDKIHYRDILSEQDKKKIEEMFAEEIGLLGYTF